MRRCSLAFAVVLAVAAACGSGKQAATDASPASDAATCPTRLLAGGTDVAPQGWSVVMQLPATLRNGVDYVELQTSTGATTSGQLLLSHPGAVEIGKPFKLQVVMLVESVNPHNQFDSAAAIMASYTPPFGASNDRNQMVYLDSGKLGWADDTQSFTASITNNT